MSEAVPSIMTQRFIYIYIYKPLGHTHTYIYTHKNCILYIHKKIIQKMTRQKIKSSKCLYSSQGDIQSLPFATVQEQKCIGRNVLKRFILFVHVLSRHLIGLWRICKILLMQRHHDRSGMPENIFNSIESIE